MPDFKPKGYNSLSPYFIVRDAEKFITLIQNIFNAELLRKFERPDGRIMHAEVKIDDSVVMLGEATDSYPPNQLLVHVYVPDVDSVFKSAIELGCTSIEEPLQKENDPDKRGQFEDPDGNIWAVGMQSATEPG